MRRRCAGYEDAVNTGYVIVYRLLRLWVGIWSTMATAELSRPTRVGGKLMDGLWKVSNC